MQGDLYVVVWPEVPDRGWSLDNLGVYKSHAEASDHAETFAPASILTVDGNGIVHHRQELS